MFKSGIPLASIMTNLNGIYPQEHTMSHNVYVEHIYVKRHTLVKGTLRGIK